MSITKRNRTHPILNMSSLMWLAKFFVLMCLTQLSIGQSHAAVADGAHMDFVLNSGRTVRVFPEAENLGPIKPGNILPKRQRVNTRPPGGDPCKALEKQFNKTKNRRKRLSDARKNRKSVNPAWLKTSRKLKSKSFRRAHFKKRKPTNWYFMLTTPEIAFKDNIPEATFIKFITDETAENGGAEGGLFHLMATYGLSQDEQKELEVALKEAVPGARLKGMVDLEPSKSVDNFVVTSGTLSDEGFSPTGILTSGRAPTMPGARVAMAGRLTSLGAQLMEASFENTTTDLSVTFNYDYVAKTQAYKAEVRIDMDRIQDIQDCVLQTRDRTETTRNEFNGKGFAIGLMVAGPIGALFGGWDKKKTVSISEQDLSQGYETMISLGAVEIRIDQNLPDADVSAIESSLMEMAMGAFTSMQQSFATSQELQAKRSSDASDADKEAAKQRAADKKRANHHKYFKLSRKQTRQTGVQTFKIEKGVAIYRTHSMTGNIGGFIRDYKDQIYDEVLLNDPFFRRGVITVDLDTEALDLFEENMINNASVRVIVPFPGDPYDNGDVFTRADISSGNILKKFTYATRGKNMTATNCPYKYIESWSLKGGGKYPERPVAKCATEMAVTLVPPIKTRRVDVEADLAEMTEMGVRGADVLLRHKRYGRSIVETSRFRVAKGEAYQEQTLFVDKDDDEIEYQIVLTHKDKGSFSSDWRTLDGDFVFANLSGLPLNTLEEIRQKVPEIKEIIDEVKGLLE